MLDTLLGQDSDRSFSEDERAIEGLPIRLVIALVVGVACLGIMMQVLGTFDFGADQEADVQLNDRVVQDGEDVTITVVEESTNEPIPGASVIVRGDNLAIENTYDGETGDDGNLTFTIGSSSSSDVTPDWRTTQEIGKLRFKIIPPTDSPYTDDQENNKLRVTK